MQALKPIDFAAFVAGRITDVLGIAASATPIPEDLGAVLPYAVVYNVGGYRDAETRVLDTGALSIDVYADKPAQAMDVCAQVAALVDALSDDDGGAVQVYTAQVTTLPYDNPDPRHPTIYRATCAADVMTRGEVITI